MELLDNIIKLLEDKKAIDLTTLDIKEQSTLADYFIITSGTSNTHIKALADNVEVELKKTRHLSKQNRRLQYRMDINGLRRRSSPHLHRKRKTKLQPRRTIQTKPIK